MKEKIGKLIESEKIKLCQNIVIEGEEKESDEDDKDEESDNKDKKTDKAEE